MEMADRLARLVEDVPAGWKGAPLGASMSLRDFAASGVDALGGALPLPLLLLRESAVAHNIARMARFATDEDALLAPHAKTTMSPELIVRQLEAGCWAITVATAWQAATLRHLGVQRIVLANQLVERGSIRWLADEQRRDPGFELICLVDSTEGVELLDRELEAARAPRPVPVFLEVGAPRTRAGVRSLERARAVARAASSAPRLELIGVELFEGLGETLAAVDEHLAAARAVAEDLHTAGLVPERLVSAGGSAYFDRVLAAFPRPEWQVVLRSGCYVTQDGGFYDDVSPLAGRGQAPDPLRDALELWGAVLSCPEPGVAVVGAGRRDAPFDLGLPHPVAWRSADGTRAGEIEGASVLRLNDQHMTIATPARAFSIGDLVRFTVSHPCGAFDRWRVIALVDDDRRVVGAVHTAF